MTFPVFLLHLFYNVGTMIKEQKGINDYCNYVLKALKFQFDLQQMKDQIQETAWNRQPCWIVRTILFLINYWMARLRGKERDKVDHFLEEKNKAITSITKLSHKNLYSHFTSGEKVFFFVFVLLFNLSKLKSSSCFEKLK